MVPVAGGGVCHSHMRFQHTKRWTRAVFISIKTQPNISSCCFSLNVFNWWNTNWLLLWNSCRKQNCRWQKSWLSQLQSCDEVWNTTRPVTAAHLQLSMGEPVQVLLWSPRALKTFGHDWTKECRNRKGRHANIRYSVVRNTFSLSYWNPPELWCFCRTLRFLFWPDSLESPLTSILQH